MALFHECDMYILTRQSQIPKRARPLVRDGGSAGRAAALQAGDLDDDDDDAIVDNNEIDTNNNLDAGDWALTIAHQYRNAELKKWRPAPVVPEIFGRPGELGKAVRIPDAQKTQMLEKFKENQFNLMASDMISLNRSLADVRNPKYVTIRVV